MSFFPSNKTFRGIISRTGIVVLSLFLISSPLWFYDEIIEPIRDAVETASDSRLAAVLTIRNNAVRYATTPERFPAVLLDNNDSQLIFFDRTGALIKKVPAEPLRQDLKPPPQFTDDSTLHIDSEVLQTPDGAFYFFAASSY